MRYLAEYLCVVVIYGCSNIVFYRRERKQSPWAFCSETCNFVIIINIVTIFFALFLIFSILDSAAAAAHSLIRRFLHCESEFAKSLFIQCDLVKLRICWFVQMSVFAMRTSHIQTLHSHSYSHSSTHTHTNSHTLKKKEKVENFNKITNKRKPKVKNCDEKVFSRVNHTILRRHTNAHWHMLHTPCSLYMLAIQNI